MSAVRPWPCISTAIAPRFGELIDHPVQLLVMVMKVAVEQHHRFAAAVDLVVHFQPVDRRVIRRWLLLLALAALAFHQEESYCPHVWCNSLLSKAGEVCLGSNHQT